MFLLPRLVQNGSLLALTPSAFRWKVWLTIYSWVTSSRHLAGSGSLTVSLMTSRPSCVPSVLKLLAVVRRLVPRLLLPPLHQAANHMPSFLIVGWKCIADWRHHTALFPADQQCHVGLPPTIWPGAVSAHLESTLKGGLLVPINRWIQSFSTLFISIESYRV